MSLKQVITAKRMQDKKKALAPLLEKREALKARRAELAKREGELEEAVQEITEETAAEAQADVEAAVAAFEEEAKAVEAEAAENDAAIQELEAAIDTLQTELDDIAAKVEDAAAQVENELDPDSDTEERSHRSMKNNITRRVGRVAEQVRGFVGTEPVKAFLATVRSAISEKRAITNAGLLIPQVMLGLVREEVARQSRLLPFVNLRHVGGEGRLNIAGKIPEAVWSEMCANINELSLAFGQIEVDGFKANGYMAICNAVLEDSDVDLAAEIVDALTGALAKALDKAILYGSGAKMPIGIATRLAATSEPSWWGANEPAFTDLHATNIQKLNIGSATGVAFFTALITALGVAKPKYSADGLFWVMNRKTHIDIMTKALAFDSAAALVSNTDMMPVLGGTVVEIDDLDLPDYEIIGGFGGNYLLAERAGVKIASSDLPLFLADQTVFKVTARYDGRPVCGEAFVIVNYANTDVTTSKSFPTDYANADLNTLTLTAANGAASGKTVVTVTDYLASADPVLKYKVAKVDVAVGDVLPAGFETLTSGSTAITAAAGKLITVVELDANNRIVSAGTVASNPKA